MHMWHTQTDTWIKIHHQNNALFKLLTLNSSIIFIYLFVCVLSFCHAGLASESGHQDSSKDHQLLSPLSAHFILSWMKPPCQSVKSYLRRLHWLVSLSIASRKSIYTFSVSENVLLCRFEMHGACYQREGILAFWECLYFFKTLLIFLTIEFQLGSFKIIPLIGYGGACL